VKHDIFHGVTQQVKLCGHGSPYVYHVSSGNLDSGVSIKTLEIGLFAESAVGFHPKMGEVVADTLDNVVPGAGVNLPSSKNIRIEGLHSIDQCVYHFELRILVLDVGPALAVESQARVGIVMVFIRQGNNTDTSSKPVNNCTSMGHDILRLDDDTNIS